MPGHVALHHPGLNTTIIVDAGAAPHLKASGWEDQGPAIPIPEKPRRPAAPPGVNMARVWHPGLGVGDLRPAGSVPLLRRGGWILESEWFAQQEAEAARAAAAGAAGTAAAPVTVSLAAPGESNQEQ